MRKSKLNENINKSNNNNENENEEIFKLINSQSIELMFPNIERSSIIF
jgi:hypothetical protein